MPFNYKTEINRYRRYYQSIEPILTKPKSRVYTTAIFSFLAVSLFGWYAIRPTIQTILSLKREIKDKTEIDKKMEDKIAALIEAQAYYQEVESLLPALDQALPQQPDAIPLVVQLRNLAEASGTQISAIQLPTVPLTGKEPGPGTGKVITQTKKTDQQQKEFNLSIAVRGSYQGIRAFLEGVTQMRRIVSVYGVTISPVRAEESGSQSAVPASRLLQLALQLKAYYLVQ